MARRTIAPASALFPALAIHRFHGGAGVVGLLYAAPYAGALVASLLSGWVGHVRRQGLVIVVAASLWGVAIAAFGFATTLWVGLLLLALAGAADLVSAVLRSTILMSVTPQSMLGRMLDLEFAQVASAPALGNLEAGVVASLTSLRTLRASSGLPISAPFVSPVRLVSAFSPTFTSSFCQTCDQIWRVVRV